jgi:4'-phosphopantetheinyl transferase
VTSCGAIRRADSCVVWIAQLPDTSDHVIAGLDPHELQRRARFRLAADRDRFTVGAALLRLATAEHFGISPGAVRINRTCPDCGRQHGRPRVVSALAPSGVDVSVSHSGLVIAVAVSTVGAVGVDVEVIPSHFEHLADVACSPEERDRIRCACDFATVWVRKEAVLKAAGTGLRRAPSDVVVSPPDRPARLVRFDEIDSTQCQVSDLDIDGAHVGAVAVLSDQFIDLEVRDGMPLLKSAFAMRIFAA